MASPKQELPGADLLVCVYMPDLPAEQLRVRVRPGAPHSLQLKPDHPWCLQVGVTTLPCNDVRLVKLSTWHGTTLAVVKDSFPI